MNSNQAWIAMAERRPTVADFVKDEWAVELLFSESGRVTQYTYRDLGETRCTHWRRVRLCPPPVEENRDEKAWNAWSFGETAPTGSILPPRYDCFLAGRRTMREEIAGIMTGVTNGECDFHIGDAIIPEGAWMKLHSLLWP